MHKQTLPTTFYFFLSLFIVSSCSVSPTNTDLKEYGYKGSVKKIVSTIYTDLEKKNGEWIIDDSKIKTITTVSFNEIGNMTKSVTEFGDKAVGFETLHYQYDDDLKSGFVRVNKLGDTLDVGTYTWTDEFNYQFTVDLGKNQTLLSTSKLNENHRDLSGSTQVFENDTLVYSSSYSNQINDEGLLTRSDYLDVLSNEKSSQIVTYSNFDSEGNPEKFVIEVGETGELKQLTIREFSYFK